MATIWRSLLVGVRQPFTCIVAGLQTQLPQTFSVHVPGAAMRVARLQTSACMSVLDKAHPHKKSVVKTEGMELPESDEEVKVDEFQPGTLYPTPETHAMLLNGIRFDQLPVVHIKSSHNNTILTAAYPKGLTITQESGGSVGFRNARKGTNIAAQAAALAVAEKIIAKGVKTVRISLRGVGPGKMPALKGLQMGGLTIVSITEATPLPFNGNRPRKVRKP